MAAVPKKVIKTDRYDLAGEWEKLASTYHEEAIRHADATYDRDKAKTMQDLVWAKVVAGHRLRMEREGSKVTETALQNMAIASPDYRTAVENFQEAEHVLNDITGTLRALEFKKRALEYLTQLELRDWNSEPKAPRALRTAEADASSRAQREGLNTSMQAASPRPRRIEA